MTQHFDRYFAASYAHFDDCMEDPLDIKKAQDQPEIVCLYMLYGVINIIGQYMVIITLYLAKLDRVINFNTRLNNLPKIRYF